MTVFLLFLFTSIFRRGPLAFRYFCKSFLSYTVLQFCCLHTKSFPCDCIPASLVFTLKCRRDPSSFCYFCKSFSSYTVLQACVLGFLFHFPALGAPLTAWSAKPRMPPRRVESHLNAAAAAWPSLVWMVCRRCSGWRRRDALPPSPRLAPWKILALCVIASDTYEPSRRQGPECMSLGHSSSRLLLNLLH